MKCSACENTTEFLRKANLVATVEFKSNRGKFTPAGVTGKFEQVIPMSGWICKKCNAPVQEDNDSEYLEQIIVDTQERYQRRRAVLSKLIDKQNLQRDHKRYEVTIYQTAKGKYIYNCLRYDDDGEQLSSAEVIVSDDLDALVESVPSYSKPMVGRIRNDFLSRQKPVEVWDI